MALANWTPDDSELLGDTMPGTDTTYWLQGEGGPSLVVSADGLSLTGRRRRAQRWTWRMLAATRWQEDGSAVITLRDRSLLALPGTTERLAEAVATIDRFARQASDERFAQQRADMAVRHLLERYPGDTWRPARAPRGRLDLNWGPRTALAYIVLLALLIGGARQAPILAGLALLGMICLAGLAAMAWFTLGEPPKLPTGCELWATAEAIFWLDDGETCSLPWAEVRGGRIAYDNDDGTCSLRLRAVGGRELVCRAPATGLEPLLACLRQISADDEDRYQAAGAQPLSPRSISPARLTEGVAERGLSQAQANEEQAS